MTNSPLIDPVENIRRPRLYSFVTGDRPNGGGAPEWAAWNLEAQATALGWPEGHRLGSEGELLLALGVSRETFREAIRIVERRGSMRMMRGRFGGLRIARPDAGQAVVALAIHLRAIGCTVKQGREAVRVLRELGDADEAIVRLAQDTTELLAPEAFGDGAEAALLAARSGMFTNPEARAATIAIRLINANMPLPSERGSRLGSEWDLSAHFSTSRQIIRQALRVLADFDMIETRRGRGGGVFLKRPSPIGVVRQLFPYLAGQRSTPYSLLKPVWQLNLAHLLVAGSRLTALSDAERAQWAKAAESQISGTEWPERWVVLQQAIAAVAANPLLDTLVRCLVAYQSRVSAPLSKPTAEFTALLETREKEILLALAGGMPRLAEGIQRSIQQAIEEAYLAQVGDAGPDTRASVSPGN